MGLSSKQVSSDNHGWNQSLLQTSTIKLPKPPSLKRQASQLQQQQQQVEALKCPRCDSTNTKFCYYNNYNKSQPRHFCKACKRHWTKGGTLRNVPMGGGRKNKRLKTSNSGTKAASKTTTTTTSSDNIKMLVQGQHQQQPPKFTTLPLGGEGSLSGLDEKSTFTEAFYQTLVRQPPCSMPETSITFNTKSLSDGDFLGNDLQFPYSNLGNIENNPCSISSSNLYSYTVDQTSGLEETAMNNLNKSSSSMNDHQQPWATATTTITTAINGVIDTTSSWGWDDFDKFVSVDAHLSMPWDDTEIKPPGSKAVLNQCIADFHVSKLWP